MTPRDHSKTIAIAYSIIGVPLALLILASPLIIAKNVDEFPSPRRNEQILISAVIFCIVFLMTILLLSTAYGLFRRKSWARVTALIISSLIIWWFPLGTALS